MNKLLKSILALIIVSTLVLPSLSICFAETCEGDKYLSSFVIDISEGSDNTLGEINDFDRYMREFEMAQVSVGGDYVIAFGSGDADHTHQYIASNAVRILANDKGNCLLLTSSNSQTLIEYADWPDKHDIGFIFDSHFYNPSTETNYTGSTSGTAKTKATTYYNNAVTKYKNGDVTGAIQELGKGSHFCQDACEAHHATNKTALGSNHSSYETYIDNNRKSFYFPSYSLDESVYEEALYCSVGQLLRNNSYASYCLGDRVTTSSSSPDYFDAARATVMNGIVSTVQYYYKFAVEVGLYN